MNRKRFLLCGIVSVLLVFGSCATKQVIFDENLPLEEAAQLFFHYGLEVNEYNGIPVPTKTIMLTTTSTWHDVYLPPGEMEFKCDVNVDTGYYVFHAQNVYFRYKFDAGRYYALRFTWAGGSDENTWGVWIYDIPSKKPNDLKGNLIAFTPFYKL